jgi:hypothetical protein
MQRLPLLLASSLLTIFVLACACGSGSGDGVDFDADAPEASTASAPEGATASPTAAATDGRGFPATAEGVCDMWQACSCLNDPMSACLSTLRGPGFDGEVLGCIAAQGCTACDDTVSKGCIDSVYGARSARSAAEHETTMGIIENYPTGGNCSSGQREVRDRNGNFIRCQ